MRALASLAFGIVLAGSFPARALSPMRLTSPAVGADGRIAAAQSNYGANRSPSLTWTPVPGAKSYALVLDDPDAPGGRPFVHWLIWNIPGAATALGGGLPPDAHLASLAGASQGRNGADSVGYFGPRPPSGLHHYHFHIFALDARLSLAPGSDRSALSTAMNGHVLAAGELVGTFAAP